MLKTNIGILPGISPNPFRPETSKACHAGRGMTMPRVWERRLGIYLYRIEAVASRLRIYASKFRDLERRALSKADESSDALRAFYLREAENARYSGEVLDHMASRLEMLVRMLRSGDIRLPSTSLAVEEVLGELARIKVEGRFSGSPAMLVAEAESTLHELIRAGQA
jgi:hypothetical protein